MDVFGNMCSIEKLLLQVSTLVAEDLTGLSSEVVASGLERGLTLVVDSEYHMLTR